MGDQPGAGGVHSYKIRGHSRQRRSAKPYSRPSDRKKGVLESVKNFFSPSWLVDFWKGKITSKEEVEDDEDVEDPDNATDTIERGQNSSGGATELVNTRPSRETSSNTTESIYKSCGNSSLESVASAQIPKQTSRKSGLSAFLALTSRHNSNKETVVTRTAGGNFESSRPSHQERPEVRPTSSVGSSSDHIDANNAGVSTKALPTRTAATTRDPNSKQTTFDLPVNVNRVPSQEAMPSLFSTSTPMPGASTDTPVPSLQRKTLSTRLRPQPSAVFKDRPEFSIPAFGSPLPPRQSSGSKRFLSPFYSGQTTFGGASTKRMRMSSPSSLEHSKPIKKQIKPTPITGTGIGGVTSQTAKRILETLENMSTPLVDAKKIPPSPLFSISTSPITFEQSLRKQSSKQKAKFGAPPVASFSIPQRASISRIPSKVTSTRSSTTTSKTQESSHTRQSSSTVTSKPTFTPVALPMSLSPMETSKGGGKMKTAKSNTHYKSQEAEDEVVNPLPEIVSAVPLSIPHNVKLPSFSFSPSSRSSKSLTSTTTKRKDISFVTPKSKQSDITKNNFKFSIPEPKASSLLSSSPSQTSADKKLYSFSVPVPINKSDMCTNSGDMTNTTTSPLMNKYKPEAEGSWECSSCMVNNKASATSCIACCAIKPIQKTALSTNDLPKKITAPESWCCGTCSTSNKSSDDNCIACKMPKPSPEKSNSISVLKGEDLLKRFAPSKNSWECSTCMINNNTSDNKCVACETPKPTTSQTTSGLVSLKSDNLMTKFAPPKDSWECSACMLNNKGTDSKCVACQMAKPNSSQKPSLSVVPKSDDLLKKFAPPQDSWECSECMLSNRGSDNKCVACQTTKPGGQPKPSPAAPKVAVETLSNKFAPALGSWTCDECMIVNKPDTLKCLACESAKPGSTMTRSFSLNTGNSGTKSSFTFGGDNTCSTANTAFQFGSSKIESSGPSVPFKFGSTAVTVESQAVVFGVSDSKKSESSKSGSFVFGASVSSTTDTEPSFTFGYKSVNSSSSTPTIQFGAIVDSTKELPTIESGFNAKSVDSQPAMQFGASLKTDEKKDSPFTFGGGNTAVQFGSVSVAKKTPMTNPAPIKGTHSIADATVAGLLKIPSSAPPTSVVDLTDDVSNKVEGSAPASVDQPETQPSNQLFSNTTTTTKSETTGSATLPSLPFVFGATSVSKPTEEPSKAVPTFSFVPGATSKVASTAVAPAATVLPFNFASPLGSNNKAECNPTSSVGMPQFGSFGTAPTSTVTGFSEAVTATTTAVTPFLFKAAPAISTNGKFGTPSVLGGFNFGAPSSNATTGTGGFAFTATSTAALAPNTSPAPFAFGSQGTSESKGGFNFAMSSQPFAFGGSVANNQSNVNQQVSEESMDADGNNNSSQPAALAFGSQTNPSVTPFTFNAAPTNTGFSFGNTPSPAAGFKFGTSQPPSVGGAGAASVPNFGAPASTLAGSGGFNFGSPATNSVSSTQPGGFMAAESGVGFSAGSGGVQKRIIKKGVRRMKR